MDIRITAAALCAALAGGLALLAPTSANAADPCATGRVPSRVPANTVATANPLDDQRWAVGEDWYMPAPNEWNTYCSAPATEKALLGKMTLQPRLQWYGRWRPTSKIQGEVRNHIDRAQHGDRRTMVGLALMRAHTMQDKDRRLTDAERADFVYWINAVYNAIGSTPTMVVLEPDLGVAVEQAPDPGVRLQLVNYAARKLSQLPNTHIYIDGTASDWMTPAESAAMLRAAGVAYVRGFALGATHYATLGNEIVYAKRVSDRLAALGIPGRKALIDTADNAKGFTYHQYYAEHPRSEGNWFDNAQVCASKADTTCVTLGIPPTWRVGDRISNATLKSYALRYVDGYAWFGRPWLYAQASPYVESRALQLGRTTPFQ